MASSQLLLVVLSSSLPYSSSKVPLAPPLLMLVCLLFSPPPYLLLLLHMSTNSRFIRLDTLLLFFSTFAPCLCPLRLPPILSLFSSTTPSPSLSPLSLYLFLYVLTYGTGVYTIPFGGGILLSGLVSGKLADRSGPRKMQVIGILSSPLLSPSLLSTSLLSPLSFFPSPSPCLLL